MKREALAEIPELKMNVFHRALFLMLALVAGLLLPASLHAQGEVSAYRFPVPRIDLPAWMAGLPGEGPAVASEAAAPAVSTVAGENVTLLSKNKDYRLSGDYFSDLVYDTGYVLSSPLRWDRWDWLKVSLVLGGTGVLFIFDEEIQDWVQDHRGGGTDRLSDIVEPLGSGLYVVPALGLVYGWGHFMDNERARRVGLLGVESYLISNLMSMTIKWSTGRHRPGDHRGAHAWDPFKFNGNLSFPSGHTASAFSVATVIATEYDEHPFLVGLAYGLATLTAYSRLNGDWHFASDVFMGGAIGYFTAKTVMKLHDNKSKHHFTIYPSVGEGQAGLMLGYRF